MSIWTYDDAGQPLTNEALLAEIAAFRKALREIALGGGVGVVAGEGRRLEFTKSNAGAASGALRDLLQEAKDRGLDIGSAGGGGSIVVEFGA
jgi:hypothetical protein